MEEGACYLNKRAQGSELGILRVGTQAWMMKLALEAGVRVRVDPGKQPDLGLQSRFVGKVDEDFSVDKTTPRQHM